MVTGGYPPEFAGGVRQCQELIEALRHRLQFTVLTMTANRKAVAADMIDGTPVHRVLIDVDSWSSRMMAAVRWVRQFVRLAPAIDIVHVHGYSQRVILTALLSRLWRKPLMFTMQTGGHDDAVAVKTRSRTEFWGFSRADLYTAVSPALAASYRAAGLPASKLRLIPNAVDVKRFRPAVAGEQAAVRRDLGLPSNGALILFVAAFFSADKCPDVLFDAWTALAREGPTTLLFIGATRSGYVESDAALAGRIRSRARDLGLSDRVLFVESAEGIERYYRAADICVLPSIREGLSKTLLEAMASGLPCVATRLPGSTDWVIDDGVDGLLVPPRDAAALAASLRGLLSDEGFAARVRVAARRTVESRFASEHIVPLYLDAYRHLLGGRGSSAMSVAPGTAAS